jgi:hypothetical protein
MNFDDNKMTTGQAFVELKSDEQAKVAAALFNGLKLDAKHTISSCTIPDFDKIMAIENKSLNGAGQDETSFLELNSHCLETRKTTYAFQKGK